MEALAFIYVNRRPLQSRGHDSLASLSPERDLGGLDVQLVLILDIRGIDSEVDDVLDSTDQTGSKC